MALAYLTINLDAFTGDDHPPISQYSTITLDPGADHIDAAADVIHVRTIVVSLDRQGKAATANGVPCVDGKVPVVAGVAYAVSAPNVLRDGPHYIPALTAGQVVDLSDYITPGAPLTPDQAAILTARIVALEAAPPGSGVTDHGALTGLGDDDHGLYALADGTRGAFAAPLTADDTPAAPAEGESATYFVTSAVSWPVGLVWSTDPDGGVEPTITDAALVSMFTLDGTTYAVLGSTFPVIVAPDVTAPTAGTLSVTAFASTTINVSVAGASDETALHATPYAFSSDNGGTYSAYQSGATYGFTGLAASTSYTLRHRVRDAAGNVTVGTAVVQATDAAPADSTPPTVGTLAGSSITSSGFTLTVTGAADETALHATPYRFSTDNGATYSAYQSSAVYAATGLTASTGYTCKHQTRDAAGNVSTGTGVLVTTGAEPFAATYLGRASNNSPAASTTTFAGLALGTPSANRHIIVAVAYSGGGGISVTALTVGGVSATIDATYYNATGSRGSAIARAVVPSGTTGDVVVTISGSPASRLGVGVWAVTGAPSLVLVDNDANMFTDAAANSLTLTAVADGVVIAHAHGGAADHAWTNVTERYDALDENGFSGADAATTTTSHTVTVQKAAATYTLQAVTYEAGA